jgi:hypothetical protein
VTKDDLWFDKFEAEFEENLRLDIASWDFRDSLRAHEYIKEIHVDGWQVDWARVSSREWEARISCPSIPSEITARGRTRLSAITAAYQAAFRRLKAL